MAKLSSACEARIMRLKVLLISVARTLVTPWAAPEETVNRPERRMMTMRSNKCLHGGHGGLKEKPRQGPKQPIKSLVENLEA